MNSSLIERIIKELSVLFNILSSRLATSTDFVAFARELGWDFPEDRIPDFSELINQDIPSLTNSIIELDQSTTDGDRIVNLFALIDDFLVTVEELKNIGAKFSTSGTWPGTIDINEFVSKFPEQLLHYLIIEYLERYHRGIYALCRMTDAIHVEDIPQAGSRLAYTGRTFDLSKLTDFITNPKTAANTLYKWGSDQFEAQRFLDLLEDVCIILGIPAGQYLPDPTIASRLLEIPDSTHAQMGKELRIPIYEIPNLDLGYVEAGICVYPIPDKEEPPGNSLYPGVALIPYINGSIYETLQLGGGFELTISGDLSAGIAIEVRPGKTSGKANLLSSEATSLSGEIKATISRPSRGESIRIFEGPGSSYFAIQDISHSLGVIVTSQNGTDVYGELTLNGGTIVISAGEGDGFLQKILPSNGIRAGFDITTGWSSERGIYFRGSGALEITIPIHETIGPLTLESIYLTINFGAEISTILAVSAGAKLGPVAASVERIGVEIPIVLKSNSDGNLGPIQVDKPKFKPPLGAGLAIEAGPVVGGGYLTIDHDNKRYAGILQLKMGEIGLTAIGLITTRMPDGSDGFALLVSIGVEFAPPIQISFGFTLSAVGGLVGINREMLLDVLRAGVRNRTLDSVLFPVDPIANAPKIISDLRAVFPPEEDRFVVGPMLRIGWGSPTIITAELGVFIALPSPVRIAILGQFAAALPDEKIGLIELHVDVLGTIDFGKKTLTIDASLYDSRVLALSLSGDAAVRLCWGDKPYFGISLGGFHPRFARPPQFPDLRRLCLSIGSGNNPRLTCEMYLALTSNSLQFGALVELYIKVSAVKIHGYMGFDALFYFSPFGFDVSIKAGISVSVSGVNLLAIRLYLQLAGTTPWHAEGEASFEILWWEIEVHFSKTWGKREKKELPAVNPWNDFVAALERPESWGTKLPDGRFMVESLRSIEREAAEVSEGATGANGETATEETIPLLAHPAGTLEVRQKVLPLDMRLSRYGNAPIAGYHTYHIEPSKIGNGFEIEDLKDYFARSQYEKLSDTEKLSKPSYELLKNGIAFKAAAVKFDTERTQAYELKYESEYIDDEYITRSAAKPGKARIAGAVVRQLLVGAASRKSGLRTTGLKKYERKGVAAKVSASEEGYTIVRQSDMTAVTEIEGNNGTISRMAADQALGEAIKTQPGLEQAIQIVPSYEVAA